ncbi:anti-sigma-E factor RseA [Enterobacteriaceae bacterium LUAb1]
MQKEKLSALIDGELLDNELISQLYQDSKLQQRWESYHLIRDTLRGDVDNVLHVNIAARVADALQQESVHGVVPLITESQPLPSRGLRMLFGGRIRPWITQAAQAGVAACVSLVVIMGVQQYNRSSVQDSAPFSDSPVINTLPINGKASPVSLGGPVESADNIPQQLQEQRRRINVLLQDYELQRRLYAEQLPLSEGSERQTGVQVPGNQSLGTQQQQ